MLCSRYMQALYAGTSSWCGATSDWWNEGSTDAKRQVPWRAPEEGHMFSASNVLASIPKAIVVEYAPISKGVTTHSACSCGGSAVKADRAEEAAMAAQST